MQLIEHGILQARSMDVKNKLHPKIAVVGLCSPLEIGASEALPKAEGVACSLRNSGCSVIDVSLVDSPETAATMGRKYLSERLDAVVFVPSCWFEDYLVLDFIEECRVPLLLWAIPGMETGSLCGTEQLGCYLKYLEHPFHHVFGNPGNPEEVKSAISFLKACALKSKLRRSKIGIAGTRVNGMTHTSPCEFALKKTIGPRIHQLCLPDIIKTAGEQNVDNVRNAWKELKNKAGSCSVSDPEGMESIRMYLALKDAVSKNSLDALAVGCYPQLMGKVCVAASLLADGGVPLACEGDVNGAVGQLILTLLSESPTQNTDFLDPLEDGSVVFTHCGSGSFSLAEGKEKIALRSVRLMGQGTCALFPAKPGVVTLLSLIATEGGYQVAMLRGEAVKTEMIFPGNPVRIRFEKPFREIKNWVFEEGIGHHWMIAYGDYAEEIRQWSRIAGKNLRFKHLAG